MRSFLKTILLGLGIVLTAPLFLPSGTVNVRAQLSSGREAAEAIPPHGYVVASKAIKGSDIPGDYTFVLTRDEIYVPILVRKPKGNGPLPAITMGSGEGLKRILCRHRSLHRTRRPQIPYGKHRPYRRKKRQRDPIQRYRGRAKKRQQTRSHGTHPTHPHADPDFRPRHRPPAGNFQANLRMDERSRQRRTMG